MLAEKRCSSMFQIDPLLINLEPALLFFCQKARLATSQTEFFLVNFVGDRNFYKIYIWHYMLRIHHNFWHLEGFQKCQTGELPKSVCGTW